MDFQEVGCRVMDWIELAQGKDGWRTLLNAVMNIRVPQNAGNFFTSCKPGRKISSPLELVRWTVASRHTDKTPASTKVFHFLSFFLLLLHLPPPTHTYRYASINDGDTF
jgi:hypothetical protein